MQSWQAKYIGRKVNERYDEEFDLNGFYIENDEYEWDGVVCNLSPEIIDGVVVRIGWYKEQDYGGCHGRPQTRSVALNQEDIDIFREKLDAVTIPAKPAERKANLDLVKDKMH